MRFKTKRLISILLAFTMIFASININNVKRASAEDFEQLSISDTDPIGDILSKFQFFTEEDATVNQHTMGGFVCGGTLYAANQELGDAAVIPSFAYTIDNMAEYTRGYENINDMFDTTVYYAEESENVPANIPEYAQDRFRENPQYVNASSVFTQIRAESNELAANAVKAYAKTNTDDEGVVTEEDQIIIDYSNSDNRNYKVTMEEFNSKEIIVKVPSFDFFSSDVFTLTVEGEGNIDYTHLTFVVGDETFEADKKNLMLEENLPDTMSLGTTEANFSDMNFILNIPDATTVTIENSLAGHLVAPNAIVTLEGGNYEGGVIAKSFVTASEGHFYPMSKTMHITTGHVAKGDIILTVTDKETGEPIADVDIDVLGPDNEIITYTTDSNGKVEIRDIEVGDYYVAIADTPDGYTVETGDDVIITVAENQETEHEFKLIQCGNLEVTVIDEETNEPVSNVVLIITDSNDVEKEYTTDSNGKVVLNDTALGNYNIKTSTVPDTYKVSSGDDTDKTVVQSETATHVIKLISKKGNLEVIVTDKETNLPVKDAEVKITDPDGNTTTYTTDNNGKIEISNTKVGNYNVVVDKIPVGYKVSIGETATVEVKENETTTHEAEIIPAKGNLVVVVTDEETGESVSGAKVKITNPDGTATIYTTNNNGKIEISNTKIGNYDIVVTEIPEGYNVTTGKTATVEVEDNKTTTHEAEIATKKGNLVVVVTDEETGEPVNGAKVKITNPDGTTTTYTTDSNGKIEIPNTKIGNYDIVVTEIPEGYNVTTGKTATVNVKENQTTTHEAEIASKKGNLVVVVTDEDTNGPVNGAKVKITNPDGTTTTYTTDSNGKVEILNTKVGDYSIVVDEVPAGYKVSTGKTATVEVKENQTTTHEAEIVQAKGNLVVIVTDEDTDEPVSGAKVKITNPDGTTTTYTTNSNGKIEISNTKIGNYDIVVTEIPEGYNVTTGKTATVEVEENKTTTHEAEIATKKGKLVVVVTDEETGEPVNGAKVEITDPNGNKTTYTTDSNGKIEISNTKIGDYDIVVTEVPTGYNVTTGATSTKEVKENQTTTHEAQIATKKGNLEITVLDNETGDVVSGAKVKVTDPDGNTTIYTTNSNGKVTISNTKIGNYNTEVTEVPEGYKVVIGKTTTIEVEENKTSTHIAKISIKTGNLVVKVTNEEDRNPVENAEVSVTDPDGTTTTYTTDSNGKIEIFNTKVGSYDIVVDKVPTGYIVTTGKVATVEIEEDKTITHDAEINPEPKTGSLKIIVTDEKDGSPINGAKVKITDASGNKVVKTTNSNGEIVIDDTIIGDYNIEVVEIPEGYEITLGKIATVNVKENQTTVHTAKITNDLRGNLEIVVKDNKTNKAVKDAVVKVTDPDGNTKSYTTDSNGKIEMPNTKVGKYDIVVDEVPSGYSVVSGKVETKEVKYNETTTHEAKIDKDIDKGNLLIQVVDEKTNDPVSGAKVKVVDSNNNENTYTTNSEGKIVLNDIPVGPYNITITDVPTGYNVTTDKTVEKTVEKGKTVENIFKVNNDPSKEKGTLVFIIQDEDTGDYISGATVRIVDSDGNFTTYTTDSTGTIKLEDIPAGVYKVNVINIPSKYFLISSDQSEIIVEGGKTSYVIKDVKTEMPDTQKSTGTLVIVVKDINTNNLIPDATVKVTFPDGTSKEYTTDSNGRIEIPNTEVGEYKTVITKVPDGFTASTDKEETVTVEKGKTTTNNKNVASKVQDSEPYNSTIKITITDTDTGKKVPGAVVVITDPNGNESEYTTDSNGQITINSVAPGSYKMRVKSVPDGYNVITNETTTITVSKEHSEATVEVKVKAKDNTQNNNLSNTPKTSDNSPIMIIIIMFILSFAGIITMTILKKKNNR